MKVLFISPSFYPATYYGGPLFLNQTMCESLSQSDDIQLQVLTTDADGPLRRIDLSGVESDQKRNFAVHYCRRTIQPDISLNLLARLPRMISCIERNLDATWRADEFSIEGKHA